MTSANRIRTLRLARGYSLDKLAAQMGGVVTKAALSKYELGKSKPTSTVAIRLASALGVKTVELFTEPQHSVEFLAYRRRAAMGITDRNQLESLATIELQQRVRLQERLEGTVSNGLQINKYRVSSLQEVEDATVTLRREWDIGLDPIPNVTDTLEARRVHVLSLEVSEKFDGISAVVKNQKQKVIAAGIVCRSGLRGERQRMNLAHELGHLVLTPQKSLSEEDVATCFAGAFLVPSSVMYKELGNHRHSLPIEELAILKQRFGVSMQAIVMRAARLGIVSETFKANWFRQISRLGWRKDEPFPLPIEEPQRWKQLITRGLAEQVVTKEEASRYLNTTEIESVMSPHSAFNYQAFFALPTEQRRAVLQEQAKNLEGIYSADSEAMEWVNQLDSSLDGIENE